MSTPSYAVSISKKLYTALHKHRYLLVSVFVWLVFFVVSLHSLDPDFGWHLKAGEYIFQHWLPKDELFNYTTPGYAWVYHEWLFDVMVYFFHHLIGYFGLAIIFACLWTSSLWLVAKNSRIYLWLIGLLACIPFAGIRSELVSVFFISLLTYLIQQPKWRKFIPILFMLWANMHGGFVAGLIIVGVMALYHRDRQWLTIAGLAFLATFINPYGIYLYREVFTILLDSKLHSRIGEWHPFELRIAAYIWIGLLISFWWLLEKRKFRAEAAIAAIFVWSAVSSKRNVPPMIVATFPLITNYQQKLRSKLAKNEHTKNTLRVFTIIFVLLFSYFYYQDIQLKITDNRSPAAIVANLATTPCTGRLFNEYGLGGYLIWKLPSEKVYIDGRMASWKYHGQDLLGDYLKIYSDQDFQRAQFSKYNIRCAILNRGSSVAKNLKADGWLPTINSGNYVLLRQQ